ncbi:methyltransferase domain-containing protein [Streptomyces halstedii]|uniref:Methyltransferase domain-containing protein n=1 Tax=Streptomyces halstedii TaxID=1944 RepID=A0A6N9UAP0_STRHA|nr:class I SAM-dependent methyltransferase [Streptomyces halstedii]NEA20708.1 methyltransferase domain-containing protein [Streptomyces halstedii]
MFASAAATYARYRPGLPDAAVRLLADVLRGQPSQVLLDLGTGTGQVPLALLSAGADLTHIEAVDVSRQMLHQASQALHPLLGHCTLTLAHAAADEYEPLATLPGEPDSGPDLITCCRSYHWMNGQAVLAMADRVATPGAAVAIMGDGSLWSHDADWTRALRELIQHYLGSERRAGARSSYAEPRRSYEQDLADSAFNDVTEHLFPVTRIWAPQEVLGYLRTTSFAGAGLFAERHQAFEDEALALLHAHTVDGSLVEEATFRVLLARRVGGAR